MECSKRDKVLLFLGGVFGSIVGSCVALFALENRLVEIERERDGYKLAYSHSCELVDSLRLQLKLSKVLDEKLQSSRAR
jgi:hypothetical protein